MTPSAVLLGLLVATSATADAGAERAYQEARGGYYALKADPARRKLRHQWLNVARRFEAVAARYPTSPRAPDSYFTAAELLKELSRFSALDEDLKAAVSDYRKLIDGHPAHKLADDAALALGQVYLERLGQPEQARGVLQRAVASNPKGDCRKRLQALLDSLPAERPAKVAAVREPTRAPKPAPEAPEARRRSVVDAIARLGAPPASSPPGQAVEPPHEEPSAEAVAADPAPIAPEPEVDEAAQKAALPKLADVQERLRQVRVGPPPADSDEPARLDKLSPTQERAARERLTQVAKAEQRAEVSLAEQLGLKVRRVVIDAGHGGHDSGAIGKGGTREKDVALAIAKRLGQKLEAAGLQVVFTRTDDTFVRLEDRVKLANANKGDLFVSIHCNSAPSRSLRGIETYSLNIASDRYSIRLAARENASSEKGMSDLQFILADLATKANTEESTRLASNVQRGMVGGLKGKYKDVKDLGTKQALFFVLLGAKMPSILVETSFISHPDEERLLGSKSYQEDVATSIAAGIHEFIGQRARLAKID